MENKALVKLIHESDVFGTFIEVGAGQPVVAELFNVEGASKTVYRAESPYSKLVQEHKYPLATSKYRSVSKGFVQEVIRSEVNVGHHSTLHNTYFVSSFQIANKPEMLTHGWIGLRYRGVEKYYHLTLPNQSRISSIALIGSIGIRILHCKNDLPTLKEFFINESAMYSRIDIITGENGESHLEETISNLEWGLEHPITISKEGELIRLEELSRKGELLIMKGSFNPIHNYHLEIMKAAEKEYPTAIPCFSISLDTYSKGRTETLLLIERVKTLNKLGYPVILFNKGYFASNINYLRNNRFITNRIIFPMGSDTANRLLKVGYNNFADIGDRIKFMGQFQNVEFPYVERFGVEGSPEVKTCSLFKNLKINESFLSSTSIRDLWNKGELEEVKKLIPPFVYEDVIKYLNLIKK